MDGSGERGDHVRSLNCAIIFSGYNGFYCISFKYEFVIPYQNIGIGIKHIAQIPSSDKY